jgi:hypothetical protein
MENKPTFFLKFETDYGEEMYFQAASMKFSSIKTIPDLTGRQDDYRPLIHLHRLTGVST